MSIHDDIRELDSRLLVAGERLARERNGGTPDAYRVQTGVCDRLLDNRLDLMAKRDAMTSEVPPGPRQRPRLGGPGATTE